MSTEISSLLHIPISMCETATLLVFFHRFLGEKYRSKSVYVLVYSLYLCANIAVSTLFPNIIVVFSVASCFIVSFSMYKGTKFKRFFSCGLLTAYMFVSEVLVSLIASYIFGDSLMDMMAIPLVYFGGAVVSKILLFIMAFLLSGRRKYELSTVPFYYHLLLLIITYICVWLSFAIFDFATFSRAAATITHVLSQVSVAMISVMVYFVFDKIQAYAERESYTIVIEQQLRHDERLFALIESQNAELNDFRHDIINHLSCMHQLSAEKKYYELDDYLGDYTKKITGVISRVFTEKPAIDALLSDKLAFADRENIEVSMDVCSLTKFSANQVHLNIILGNIIDNAIEACCKITDVSKRYIQISMKTEADLLHIMITNSALPVDLVTDKLPETDKADKRKHGLGLSIVKRLLAQNGGALSCDYKDGEFILMAFLRRDANENTA